MLANVDRFTVRVPAPDTVSLTLAQEERRQTYAIVDRRKGELCWVRDFTTACAVVNLLNANVCEGRGA